MKERPIIFSAPMVRAILAGTKTQTRRIWKLPRGCSWYAGHGGEAAGMVQDDDGPAWWHVSEQRCPYGQSGDRLWVREGWQAHFEDEVPSDRPRGPRHTMGIPAQPERKSFVFYRADGPLLHPDGYPSSWYPSIHMPRKYSRITLEITSVRVERLQAISEADARAEGISGAQCPDWHATTDFRALWESLHGPGSWDANPWVWVVEFQRINQTGNT